MDKARWWLGSLFDFGEDFCMVVRCIKSTSNSQVLFCRPGLFPVLRWPEEHGCPISRMDNLILFIIEDNYSRLMQYEILEKPVTFI